MNRLTILLFLFISGFVSFVNSQEKPKTAVTPKVVLYYFHPTERCPIDQSIEENTRLTMQSYFSKEIKNGTVKLLILNTEDNSNAKIVSTFDINVQALYLVKMANGKEIKTDLTTFAFDYGKSNPQKFKIRLKDEIETALK